MKLIINCGFNVIAANKHRATAACSQCHISISPHFRLFMSSVGIGNYCYFFASESFTIFVKDTPCKITVGFGLETPLIRL